MQKLASEIRDKIDSLAEAYDGRLQLVDDGDFARGQLSLLAHCLELQDGAPFVQATREQLQSGIAAASLNQALTALEQTLIPLVAGVESATFLWGTLSRAREVLLRPELPEGREYSPEGREDATTAPGESEELFRLVVENSLASIFIVDDKFRFIYTNDQLLDLVGYTRQEVIGENFQTFLDEESKQLVTDRYVRRQRGEHVPSRYEFNIVRKDGEKRRVEISSVTVQDPAGKVRTLAQLTDITERKVLEERIQGLLERREQQVRTSAEVAQEIAAAPVLDELYRRVVTLIKERFDYYHTQLFLLERAGMGQPGGDELRTVAAYGQVGQTLLEQGHQILVGTGVVGRAAASGRPVLSSDTSQDPEWLPHPLLPETRGEIAVPILWRDRVMGVLDVQSDQAGALTEDDQLLLEGLCGQIAIAIESTRLRQEMEENLAELEGLYRTMSREGWRVAYEQLPSLGYRFESGTIEPVEAEDAGPSPSSPAAAVAPLDVRGHTFGLLGVQQDDETPLSSEELALVDSVSEQVSLALEGARLFEEEQRARALLAVRVKELDCLNDIGRAIDEGPTIPDLLEWAAGRIPEAMQFPELAVVAVEFEGQTYGDAEATTLPCQIVQSMHFGRESAASDTEHAPAGRVCIAYKEGTEGSPGNLDFLDEESALLGDITRRLTGYIENRRLMAETREAAQRLERERFLLRTVIDNLPDHIYAKDKQSRFTVNNRAHLQVIGASSQEEVVGKTDMDIFPDELASQYYAEEQEILSTGQAQFDKEHRVHYQSTGETRWALSTKLPLRGPDGEIYGLVGLTRDISERKRAEEIEERRQRQLQCLSDVGQQIGASPSVPEFLEWLAERIPAAMQYPDFSLAAIEYEGEVYGAPEATTSPEGRGHSPEDFAKVACQMVQNLSIGGQVVGRICLAYARPAEQDPSLSLEFLDEESALLGDIARRVAGYVENRRLLSELQSRAERERLTRTISDRVRRAVDREAILRTAVSELGDMLGASDVVVRLGTQEQLVGQDGDNGTNGDSTEHRSGASN